MMENIHIHNKNNQKIAIQIDKPQEKKGIVFIAHGLGGFKEQIQIESFAKTFLNEGYIVIRWDATNSLGESEGSLSNATLTNYYADMVDVIAWTKKQPWYDEPFFICGHSLGGACSIMYAASHSDTVKGIVPISPFISGKLYLESFPKDLVSKWKKNGYRTEESKSKPGVIKRFNWSLAEDLLKYDIYSYLPHLTIPVLLIVGEKDEAIKLSNQQTLFEKLPSQDKEFHLIKNALHTFDQISQLEEIAKIIQQWLHNRKA